VSNYILVASFKKGILVCNSGGQMPKTKTKDWEMKSYSLETGVPNQLKEIAEFEGLSQSDMIGFLVRNWDAGINPANKLNMLLADRKKLALQIEEIDNQVGILTKQIKQFEEWKKLKSQKKDQALNILKRNILNKEFENTERLARTWQRMTGVPAIELITEATEQIRRSGV
jgi:exoribonuclease R